MLDRRVRWPRTVVLLSCVAISTTLLVALVDCVGEDPGVSTSIPDGATGDQGSGDDGAFRADGAPGDGGTDAPVTSIHPADPVAVSAGFAHACVVLQRGDVFCWGRNDFGETGEAPGGAGTTLKPHAVAWIGSGAPAYAQIALAWNHSCASDTTGGVYCWGRNQQAELGNKDDDAGTTPTPTPVGVVNEFSTAFKVAPSHGSLSAQGRYTCGVKPNGLVACWGTHEASLDGKDPGTKRSSRAIDVLGIAPGPNNLVSGGFIHSCTGALASATAPVVCWGGNKLSQTGNGNSQDAVTVTPTLWPSGAAPPTELTSGLGHVCARTAGGIVYCWGYNGPGSAAQPTGGALDLISVPTKATAFESAGKTITRVAAGGMNTCVVRAGEVLCVGANESGQLGTASVDSAQIPHPAPTGPATGIDDAIDVAVGGQPAYGGVTGSLPTSGGFACAIRESKSTKRRSVWCWGANNKGQLGTGTVGTSTAAPVEVKDLPQQ